MWLTGILLVSICWGCNSFCVISTISKCQRNGHKQFNWEIISLSLNEIGNPLLTGPILPGELILPEDAGCNWCHDQSLAKQSDTQTFGCLFVHKQRHFRWSIHFWICSESSCMPANSDQVCFIVCCSSVTVILLVIHVWSGADHSGKDTDLWTLNEWCLAPRKSGIGMGWIRHPLQLRSARAHRWHTRFRKTQCLGCSQPYASCTDPHLHIYIYIYIYASKKRRWI